LVRAIQTKEGNFPCFGTAEVYCDQLNCSFRDDCLSRNVN
ncbi:MAG: SAP domain-containing protein, partial [Deltaproteobacteria bacterium]|nr:SAP domain-containing protein [Deltaproteobacteria bacterium]